MSVEKQQEVRVILRERFLRIMSALKDTPVKMSLHENSYVRGVFQQIDKDVLHWYITDLHTPNHDYFPHAIIRSSDITLLEFDPISLTTLKEKV